MRDAVMLLELCLTDDLLGTILFKQQAGDVILDFRGKARFFRL